MRIAHSFLISESSAGEISASGPAVLTRHPLNRRLGGLQSRSRSIQKEKNLFPLPIIEQRFLACPANRLVTIPPELPGY